jgi:type VI secretion system secreted protein VgrG
MSTIRIDVSSSAIPEGARVIGVRGAEGVSALDHWEATILCDDPALDLEGAPGSSAAVQLVDVAEETARSVDLIVTDMAYEGSQRDGHRYALTLAPPEHLLTLRSGYRTFLDKSTRDIVTLVLADAGLPADRYEFRLAGEYLPRPYCVQYGETDWAFVERLLADEGIAYWIDSADDDKSLVVFGDDPNAHRSVRGTREIPYRDASGLVAFRHLSELEVTERMVTTSVHVRDYDVRAPDVLIEGRAGEGALGYYEFPAAVLTSRAAEQRAKARLDQLGRFQVELHAKSDCVRLQPGRVLTITDCADEWMNGDYLVVAAEHAQTEPTRAAMASDSTTYRNRLTLVPWGSRMFRPDLPRGVPRVAGMEPATTTGPSGQEIHVDDLGRLKLRFPWDRSGKNDDTSSYWVRALQMNMGGTMVLPRVGWEVPVMYMYGNPDQPFVLGRTYNATAVVPYGLPAASASTAFQSATTPNDGTTNELRMGDGAGKQEMFLHATKDQTVVVGGSAKTDVSVNETHDAKLALIADITSSQSLTVGASQKVDVGTNYAIDVKGARSETVGAMENIKVTANRRVNVGGAYTELIGALYGIQCNQANCSVKGAYTNLIGGSMGLAGGLGVSETVVAARTEIVGGAKSLTSLGGTSDHVMGIKSVTAGSTREKAGGEVSTKTKVAGSIKVGGSASMKSGSAFVIDAASITIKAASLKAGALVLDGTLKVKSGKLKVKGTIHRKGGAKLED